MKRILGALALLLLTDLAAAAVSELEYESSALSETRKILVSLPSDYDLERSRQYPVLFVLNETDNFEWAATIVEFLAEREAIDELIVVGLPADTTYGRDNYPFAGPGTTAKSEWAERHETFIRREAIPYIDRMLRTNGSRYIAGHSLSGLFVTSLFLSDPEGFNVHLAISPSYHQAPQIIEIMRDKLAARDFESGALYLAVGDLEHSLMRGNVEKMVETLQTRARSNVEWTYALLEHDNHRSTASSGLFNGLSWMYRRWDTTEEMAAGQSIDEIVSHYDALADFLGYRLLPREGNTIGLGWFLLRRLFEPAAALTAYRIALHYYPGSDEANQMVLLLEPWVRGGPEALRGRLEDGTEIKDTTILDFIGVLQTHGQSDLADRVVDIASAHYPDSSEIQRRLSGR